MCAPKAPAPPDPKATAAAQTGTNIATAIANNTMGMMDQYTPYGSLTYARVGGTPAPASPQAATPLPTRPAPASPAPTGTRADGDRPPWQGATPAATPQPATSQSGGGVSGAGESFTDPYTGVSYNLPRYASHIKLSPAEQAILDQNTGARTNLATLANERSAFLKDYLGNSGAVTDQIDAKLYDIGRQRLDPRFAEEQSAMETRLANQGITQGSPAYESAMRRFAEGKNDAYNSLILNGRNTAMGEVNMPINQITALLSGSQVNNPSVSPMQPQGMPTTDVAGLINQNYNQRLGAWQQQAAGRQSMLGGLFGGVGTILGAPAGSLAGGLFA